MNVASFLSNKANGSFQSSNSYKRVCYISNQWCMFSHDNVCMHVCIYVCGCMYVWYACMYVCMYACMYICMYVCMYICMRVYVYVWYGCMYVCMCHTSWITIIIQPTLLSIASMVSYVTYELYLDNSHSFCFVQPYINTCLLCV